MSFGRKKFLAVLSAAIMLFALEAAISAYFVVGPSSTSTTGTALAQLLSALLLGTALGFSRGRKSAVFDLDLAALERDATDDERFGVYRDTVDSLGATPFKTFLTYVPFGVLALIIGAFLERRVFGADPFKVTVLTLFNLAFLFVIGSFLYVVLDRVLLRHLLSFRIVRYPAELRDLRQKRKNTMIPTFMTIMALTAAFSYTVLLISSMPDLAAMPPMAMLLRLSSRFVPATILYLCVIIPLVIIWTENTAILHRYVLERLDQIASSEKDLTGRIHIGSVDELSAIEGRINDFTELLQKSLIEIKLAFDAFAGLEQRLETAVGKSAEDSADIGRRVAATAGLAEETDRLVEVALAAEEQMAKGVQTAVDHIERQHEAVGSSIASMRELIAAVSSAAHSAVDVRGRVERLVEAFTTGSESVKRTEESVGAVVGLSQKLREINEVIASIAARTNLLAMNAAIEAAHAGSAGAGFSVVADEIRSLAENTAKRTRESKESLGAVLEQIKKALGASEETTVAFDGIRDLLGGVDAGAAEIAANMAEQDRAGVDIAAKLEETTNLASSTLRLAEELGTATQDATSAVRSVGAESRRLRENAEAMRERNASMAASIKELESAAESTRQLGGRARDLIASFKT